MKIAMCRHHFDGISISRSSLVLLERKQEKQNRKLSSFEPKLFFSFLQSIPIAFARTFVFPFNDCFVSRANKV